MIFVMAIPFVPHVFLPPLAFRYILTDVLRRQLGFKGMLTSDDLGVQRINTTRSFAEKVREEE